jgi:uncharacterized protein (TIGR03086 family)
VIFDLQRDDYFEALDWVSNLMSTMNASHLGVVTPCDEFDVRLLSGHLIGTARRSLATAKGLPNLAIPHVVTTVPDGLLGAAYLDLTIQLRNAWARLAATNSLGAPWGSATALEAARGFTIETIGHGWDLAVATDQPSNTLDDIAQRCLRFVDEAVPDRLRGVMYDEPVEHDRAASATERLAHHLGRRRPSGPARG